MKHKSIARWLRKRRPSSCAVLVAHLDVFGDGISLELKPRTKTRQQRYQTRRGYRPRSQMQRAAATLAVAGLVKIENGRSSLTDDGRAVLSALLASYADDVFAAFRAESPASPTAREMVPHGAALSESLGKSANNSLNS